MKIFNYARLPLSFASLHRHVSTGRNLLPADLFKDSIETLKQHLVVYGRASAGSDILFGIDVLSSMDGPFNQHSYRKIFYELVQAFKPMPDNKKPFVALLTLLAFYSSQSERLAILDLVFCMLAGRRQFLWANEDGHKVIAQLKSLRIQSISADDAYRLLFVYLSNTLDCFGVSLHSQPTSIDRLLFDSMTCLPETFNKQNTMDSEQATALGSDIRSYLQANIKLLAAIFSHLSVQTKALHVNPLGIKCWEMAVYLLLRLYPSNPHTQPLGLRLFSSLRIHTLEQFRLISWNAKVRVVELALFVENPELRRFVVIQLLIPHFSASYHPCTKQRTDEVAFAFFIVARILGLVDHTTMGMFLESFIMNATNDRGSIFSILFQDQRIRLEEALFLSAARVFSRKADALTQFLNTYSAIARKKLGSTRPASFAAVGMIAPVYVGNISSLVPLYARLGYSFVEAFLSLLHPKIFVSHPGILIQALSVCFSRFSKRLSGCCRLLIDKIQSALKAEPDRGQTVHSICNAAMISVVQDIARLGVCDDKIEFKDLFPNILFIENISLSTLFSLISNSESLVLLTKIIESHPISPVLLGSFYRSMLGHFYGLGYFSSYCALLKRLVESDPIEVFFWSHDLLDGSFLDPFYQNMDVLLHMNDGVLAEVYLKRLSSCTRLLAKVDSQVVSFINHAILELHRHHSTWLAPQIPWYLNLKFGMSTLFTRKLGSDNLRRFFGSHEHDAVIFGDLCSKLCEIQTCSFLEQHEKDTLLCTLQLAPVLLNIKNDLNALRCKQLV